MKNCSIIIPVLNEADTIGATLEAFQDIRSHVELIVSDGGSNDRTVKLATPLCDRIVVGASGRARQMNAGADQSCGHILIFCHADTSIIGSLEQAVSRLNENSWGFGTINLSGKALIFRVIETCMNVRSRITHVATGDMVLIVGRDLFHRTNGFPDIPLMEDIAISKNLRALQAPTKLDLKVSSSARRWEKNGAIKTIFLMWRLRLAYFLGTSPDKLAAQYYPPKQG